MYISCSKHLASATHHKQMNQYYVCVVILRITLMKLLKKSQ